MIHAYRPINFFTQHEKIINPEVLAELSGKTVRGLNGRWERTASDVD